MMALDYSLFARPEDFAFTRKVTKGRPLDLKHSKKQANKRYAKNKVAKISKKKNRKR